MKPFQVRVEGEGWSRPGLNGLLHRGLCRETFEYNMEYLQDFIDAYPDKPLFSLTWMSYLTHNDHSGLYHADDFFYRFFVANKQNVGTNVCSEITLTFLVK